MSGPMRKLQSFAGLPALGAESPPLSPLAKKLRLGAGHTVAVLNAPPGYLELLAPGPASIAVQLRPDHSYDVVQLFVSNTEELRSQGAPAIHAVKPDGTLWIAYPKGVRSRAANDLPATHSWTKRDVLGEITGETGYKPVAFVSIDERWTALRFKRG